jgi:hypothetical protein
MQQQDFGPKEVVVACSRRRRAAARAAAGPPAAARCAAAVIMEAALESEGQQRQAAAPDRGEATRRQQQGEKLLHLAEHGQLPELHVLLAREGVTGRNGDDEMVGAIDPNFQDLDGLTALHWATVRGHVDAAELLLGFGADPNVGDRWGVHPILVPYISLATSLQSDVESDALCGGAQHPLLHEPELSEPVIHLLMQLFIGHGVRLNDPTEGLGKHTPLYYALRAGCPETVAGLRLNGADLSPLEREEVASGQQSYDPAVAAALTLEALPLESVEPPSMGKQLFTSTRRHHPVRLRGKGHNPVHGDPCRYHPFPHPSSARAAAAQSIGEMLTAHAADDSLAGGEPEPELCVLLSSLLHGLHLAMRGGLGLVDGRCLTDHPPRKQGIGSRVTSI